jgi:hypothetical protein
MKGFQLIENLVKDPICPNILPQSKLQKFTEVIIPQTVIPPVIQPTPCYQPAIMDAPICEDVTSIPVMECCQTQEIEALKSMLHQLLNQQQQVIPECPAITEKIETCEDEQCKGSQPTTPCNEAWFEYASDNCHNGRCQTVLDEEPFNVFWEDRAK